MGSWITFVMTLGCLFISSSFSATLETAFSAADEHVERYGGCTQPWCKKYSSCEIREMFKGIFFTEEEMETEQRMFEKSRGKYLRHQGVKNVPEILLRDDDGDSCCPTITRRKDPVYLNNTNKEKRIITYINDPPSYQWIPYGECGKRSGGNSCGECVMEYVTHKLLVYNEKTENFEFDQFDIPAYCSCKRSFMKVDSIV